MSRGRGRTPVASVNLNNGDYSDGVDLAGGRGNATCGVTGNPLPSTLSAAQRSTWINHLTIQGMYIGDFYAICAAHIQLDNDAGSHFFIGQGSVRLPHSSVATTATERTRAAADHRRHDLRLQQLAAG